MARVRERKRTSNPPIVLRSDDRGVLVPCNWPVGDVMRVPHVPPPDLTWKAPPVKPVDLGMRIETFHRHEVHAARRWWRHERRALARAGTHGRRGARRVPAEHRNVVHVYLPEGQTLRPEHRAVALGLLHERCPSPTV